MLTEVQKNALFNKVNVIVRLGNSVGLVISEADYYGTISYYENMAIEQGFENISKKLDNFRKLINSSTAGPILLSMVISARKYETGKQKQLVM